MITDTVLKFGYHKHGYRNVLVLESCTVPAADRYVKLFLSSLPFCLLRTALDSSHTDTYARRLPTSKGTNTRYPATFYVFNDFLGRRMTVADVLRIGNSKEGMDLLVDVRLEMEEDTNDHATA